MSLDDLASGATASQWQGEPLQAVVSHHTPALSCHYGTDLATQDSIFMWSGLVSMSAGLQFAYWSIDQHCLQ